MRKEKAAWMLERRAGSRGIAAEQRRRDWYVEWAADDDARLAVMETGQLSVRFGEGVLEVVGVFAAGDGDVEFAGPTEELASACGQHGSLAGGFEIAVDLLVDGQPAEGGVLEFAIGSLGSEFHFKGSGRVSRHDSSLLD